MRERLDCAVVSTSCTHDRVSHWFEGQPATGRLHLRALGLGIDEAESQSCRLLSNAGMSLRRFDACLLTVSVRNLAWARTAMISARCSHQTPVLALAYELKTADIRVR